MIEIFDTPMFSVLAGVLAGFVLTRWYDDWREKRARKLDIFRTLMATRADTVNTAHVNALNRIDLEFYGNKKEDKEVTEAWKIYHDHLKIRPGMNPSNEWKDRWVEKQIELFLDLMHKMALSLNYTFNKSQIKNSGYSPIKYETLENEHSKIRQGVIAILEGERSVPIHSGEHLSTQNQASHDQSTNQ